MTAKTEMERHGPHTCFPGFTRQYRSLASCERLEIFAGDGQLVGYVRRQFDRPCRWECHIIDGPSKVLLEWRHVVDWMRQHLSEVY